MENADKIYNVFNEIRDHCSVEDMKKIIAGEVLIRLSNKQNKVFTSKEEFINALETYSDSDNQLLLRDLKSDIKKAIINIPDNDLFVVLNTISSLSDQDLYACMNQIIPRELHSEHVGDSAFSNINQLVVKIADVKKNDRVLDPTSGSVGAWLQILKENPSQKITLQEINRKIAQNAYLNSKLLKATNCKIYNADVLEEPQYIENGALQLFDKVITFPPISLKTNTESIKKNSYNRFRFGKIPSLRADYAFISNAISSLNEKGKAVILVADGPLFQSSIVAKIRQRLIDEDLVEAVISLPEKMIFGTSIPMNLLIINKNKSKFKNKILFINGNQEDWYTYNKVTNCLTDNAIDKIVTIYKNKVEKEGISTVISNSEYKGVLSVKKYVLPSLVEIDGTFYHVNRKNLKSQKTTNLENLVQINRGYNVSRRNEAINGKYLSVKVTDLNNHKVDIKNLTKINIPTKPDRYLIKNNDILLSTRGTLGKIAYVGNSASNMVANANMVILRAKTDNINMKWLMLYLASPMGQVLISEIATGTTISTLSPGDLKDIRIPIISKDMQDSAVEKYEQQEKVLDKKKQELLEQYKENDKLLYDSWNMNQVLTKK